MTKFAAQILLLLTSHFLFAQITFKKGYVIDNQNKRIECLIKDNDWKNNPQAFNYQIHENSEILKGNLDNISEFGIYGKSRFKRANIDLDVSSDELSKMTYDKDPILEKRVVFLKILVEGQAKLYSYDLGLKLKFFYSLDPLNTINPLVHKKYRTTKGYAENLSFKQNLISEVNCGNQDLFILNSLKYNSEMLTKHFSEFNQCKGGTLDKVEEIVAEKEKRDFINVNFNIGMGYSKLTVLNDYLSGGSVPWDKSQEYRLGTRVEFVFPFWMNKCSFVLDPHFYFNPKIREDRVFDYESEFKYVTIPFGVSYKFFLGEESNLNVSFLHNVGTFSKSIDLKEYYSVLRPARMVNLDVGYQRKKLGVMVRYYTSAIFNLRGLENFRHIVGGQVILNYYFLNRKIRK